MLQKTTSWGSLRTSIAGLLALVLVVAACRMDQPASTATAGVTLWITPGAYHLGTAESERVPVEELPGALETALAKSATPTVLKVRHTGDVTYGYDFFVARRAACEAGVRLLEIDLDIPAGISSTGEAQRVLGSEELSPPCLTGSQTPDTAAVDVVGGPNGSRGL